MTQHTSRIALVGDRSANVRAHARIPVIIDALLAREGLALDPYWIATPDVGESDLSGFDAIWAVPGSPYESAEGALAAIRIAREQRIPFLGTCGGFQYALLEYARDVCGLAEVENAEVLVTASPLTSGGGPANVTPGQPEPTERQCHQLHDSQAKRQ